MALGKDYANQNCGIARALELVGERWTLLIIRDAFYGVRRFRDFADHLGTPRAVLAERLAALTAAGVLEKRRYCESPPRDEYVMTDMGLDLWPVIKVLADFGARYFADVGAQRLFLHAACGTELDRWGRCPSCEVPVEPGDVEMRRGPGWEPNPDNAVSMALRDPRRLLEPVAL